MDQTYVGSEESADALNRDVTLMVNEIGKIGPHVPEIARRLGRHKETVRYWYKKLQEHDFAIQGVTNHEALGLKRVILNATFNEEYRDYVRSLMIAMSDICYLNSYARALAEDYYTINCSVPQEFLPEYHRFVEDLKQMGVFRTVEVYNAEWVRNVPMQARYYDFSTGRWDFDMRSISREERRWEAPRLYEKTKFDKLDLLIAKELVTDATRELQDVQRAIKETDGVDINYKTLCWHLKEHVNGNALLKGYRLNWMGTRWDAITERAKHRSHTYVGMHLLVKEPTNEERSEIMRKMDRLPCMWAEAGGRDYWAEFAVPTEMTVDILEYMEGVISPVREKAVCRIMDQREAGGFTVSYKLFDEESRRWTFNREEVLAKFRALQVQIGR